MKTKICTQLVLGAMFFVTSLSQAQNILLDGSFESTTDIVSYSSGIAPANSWNSFKNAGVEANATVIAGVCDYQVTNGATGAWEVQLEQAGFPLILGDSYRLTFDVKADADRSFGLYLGEYEGLSTSLIGYENYWQSATTNWKTISIDFQATVVFDYHKFSCEIGGNNVSMYFDNIMLEDLGPYPSVGIIGSALSGWDVDVDMVTTDGINYSLSNYPLTQGEVKFRQNNAWSINWGNNTFPTGYAYLNGPNIPGLNFGNYDITFNKETGEYSFVCVSNCPANIGIIGSAVPPNFDLGPDVNMSTNDGVTYFLKSYAFTDGEAKFRKDDNGDINWGNAGFPIGTASLGGSAIQVTKGIYDVTFNINTGDYSFAFSNIGILGSALNGWDVDVDMQTTDGINYTLSDYPFADGEVKFRSDNNWDINWGGFSFPSGWAFQVGPNIPVLAGTYNMTFNLATGEYNFTATTCPVPGIQCPYDLYMSSSSGICGAYVFYQDVVAAPNCGGAGISITQTAGLPSGSLFPVGITTNTFVLTNSEGNTSTCSFNVMVFDTEPPVIKNVTVNMMSQWPPNHKMAPVTINYSSSDNCSGKTSCQLTVTSNASADGRSVGNTEPDWVVLDEHHVLLRAEREGKGSGREYYILIECHDEAGNYSYQQVTVTIPHDKMDSDKDPEKNENENSSKDIPEHKSATIEVLPVNAPLKVMVWPNPSAQYFNLEIKTSSDKSIKLSISDINGRLISDLGVVNKRSFRIGDDLKPGIYIVTVKLGDYFTTIKVVKR